MSDDDGCRECSRRTVLRGIGLTAAASVLGLGCGGGSDEPTVDAGDPTAGTTPCAGGVCLDLNHPANASLVNVDGARVFELDGARVIAVRRSATDFAVLSQICTHQGCGVQYNVAAKLLVCPCHGSRFSLGGNVVMSPAVVALKVYRAAFDGGMNLLTVTT